METPFYSSLRIQIRVVGALLMREVITRFGRHNIGVLWLIVEPMTFTLAISSLWLISGAAFMTNIPVIAFAITGYSCLLLWRNSASRCAKAIEPNVALMHHRNVKVIDIFLARILLEMVGATTSLVLLTVIFASTGLMNWPYDVVPVLEGWLLLGWFAAALGLVVGALSDRWEAFDRIWQITTYVLFAVSGAAYMVDWLPKTAQDMALWLPMVHGVELVRSGYFGNMVHTYGSALQLAAMNMFMTLIGLALVREAGRRVKPA